MTTLQGVAGAVGGPSVGVNFFQSDILRNSIVHFIIVNNVNECGLSPNPDYTFDSTGGQIVRGSNIWQLGDKVIIIYSKCNC